MEKRRPIPQSLALEERLAAEETKRLLAKVRGAKSGIERARLRRKVRQAETAAHIQDWLNSPGLRPPR
ncbi:hypothetical protein QA640_42480 [Bradyrhizobium sp. CB82]|nr:hypothetical protein [Bradyrhizobium sp. CB82]WFU40751.1 hypothetical protein QA640_42480 [Bradyrhizobium sp. CB82]